MAQVNIVYNQRKTMASCESIAPGTRTSDIKKIIEEQGITTGIQWDQIENALHTAIVSDEPQTNVIIARIDPVFVVEIFSDTTHEPIFIPFPEFSNICRTTSKLLNDKIDGAESPKAIYVAKGEISFRIPIMQEIQTVFGTKNFVPVDPSCLLMTSETIRRERKEKYYEYIPSISGYLSIDNKSQLAIITPISIEDNKMNMYFWVLPCIIGFSKLNNQIRELANWETDSGVHHELPNNEEFDCILRGFNILKVLVRKAIPAVNGRNAELIVHAKSNKERQDQESIGSFRDVSPLYFVKKDELIAEYTPATIGKPGKNCVGEIIPANDGRKIQFEAGKHCYTQEIEDGKINVFAEIGGVLHFRNSVYEIEEQLVIMGDVGPETGNIRYEKEVLIRGSVAGGYTLEAGGNITILGSIEDGAHVICKGNLKVSGGICGANAEIRCEGNAEVSFVQLASLTLQGDLTVNGYLYQTKVFCRGKLFVLGRKLYEDEVGAVVGGSIVSMNSMYLHSAGTFYSQTTLACGLHLEIYEKLKELRELSPVLKKRLLTIQNKIGIGLTGTTILKRLQSMPEHQKVTMKKLLEDLKSVVSMIEETERKKVLLEQKAFASDQSSLEISIQTRIIPDTKIRLCECLFPIREVMLSKKFVLRNGNVEIISNM